MCATCLNSEGAEIIDLSIFPFVAELLLFFLLEEEEATAEAFAERRRGSVVVSEVESGMRPHRISLGC